MIHAFLFLISRSFVNSGKARLKRLKQPKYLIGAIFGLIYLCGFVPQLFMGRGRPGISMLAGAGEILASLGALILLLFIASAWIFPRERAALIFTEAEIAFLFPAPVSRRALVHYKLLKSQVAILFTVLFFTLITGRFLAGGHAWMRVLGWLVILSTLTLHFLGASFARTMLLERGISNWVRRTVALLVFASILGATFWWAKKTITLPDVDTLADWKAWRDYIQSLLATPPLSYALAPCRLVLGPYLAQSVPEFFRALLPALGLILLHYLWVIRSNVAFEEASLEASRRFAEKITAMRAGRGMEQKPKKGRRAAFQLAPTGFPSVAFLWKNLISAQSLLQPRLLIVAVPLIFAAIMIGRLDRHNNGMLLMAAMVTMMLFFWSLFIGAQLLRCDFRQDLAAMDMLKVFPMRGWQVVAGEIFAPMVILAVVQWVLLALLAALSSFSGKIGPWPPLPLSWVLAAAMVTPFWNGLALLIPNAAVLYFPGWFQTRSGAPAGLEVAGQRLLLVIGQLVLILIALAPAALGFLLGFLPFYFAGASRIAPVTGAVGAAVVLAGEVALGVWFVGKLFDRFDLALEQGTTS